MFLQDSTFTFIDVAPQWQSFNAGNWLDVENGIRYLAEYYYGTLKVVNNRYNKSQFLKSSTQVWTGTYGVLQLEDDNGNLVDIYLGRSSTINILFLISFLRSYR